jgi:hypothetical protein
MFKIMTTTFDDLLIVFKKVNFKAFHLPDNKCHSVTLDLIKIKLSEF